MRSFWHTFLGHQVQAAYYMGVRTTMRRCSCGKEWTV